MYCMATAVLVRLGGMGDWARDSVTFTPSRLPTFQLLSGASNFRRKDGYRGARGFLRAWYRWRRSEPSLRQPVESAPASSSACTAAESGADAHMHAPLQREQVMLNPSRTPGPEQGRVRNNETKPI